MAMEYKYTFDDPYKILAYTIITNYTTPIVRRLMTDSKFLRREIVREIRGQDFQGYFVDCLFVAICEEKNRMDMMRALDKLGRFFYDNLDHNRMRREVKAAYKKLGLTQELVEVFGESKEPDTIKA